MYFKLEQRDLTYLAWINTSLTHLPHIHKHLEIVFVKKGKCIAVADSKEVLMEDGDIYIAFPNQIHYYLTDSDVKQELWLLLISPEACPEFKHEFKHSLPSSPVLKRAADNPKLVSAFANLIEIHTPTTKHSELEMKGYALILLCELFQHLSLEQREKYDMNLVPDIIRYCHNNYTEDISLHSMAKELHVSHYYISHVFNERLHISFRDYVNTLRINKACELLKTNELTITDISYEVGYNSPRTFDRCFAKLKGMSPKEYRIKKSLQA